MTPREQAENIAVVRTRTEVWVCEEDSGDGTIVGVVPGMRRGREPQGVPGHWQQEFVAWAEFAGEVVQARTVYMEPQGTRPMGPERCQGVLDRLEQRVRGSIELQLYAAAHAGA